MRSPLLLLLIAACGTTSTVRPGSPYPKTPIAGFYCDALSQCWITEAECPRCTRIDRAWCAIYYTSEDAVPERMMCGVSRNRCLELVGDARSRHGECVQQTVGR